MTEQLDTWYVVHEGLVDGSSNLDTNPLAANGEFTAEITEAYKKTITDGFADKDRGLYLKKLTGVTDEQANELEENLDAVVASDFEGFNVEVVEAWKSSLSDWAPEALGDLDHLIEGQEPDADGWYRS